MLLMEILPGGSIEQRQAALITKIKAIKEEIRDIKQRGLTLAQSAFQIQYAPQLARAQSQLRLAQEELASLPGIAVATDSSREFHQKINAKRGAETTDERKQRHNQAIGDGITYTNTLRSEFGGWQGLAAEVHKYVEQATADGIHKITADDIAHEFGTTNRTVNKWLERDEFLKTARLLGRR